MTALPSERPTNLEEIVRQAETLGASDRLTFLRNACGGDNLLLAQAVQRLRHSSPQWWDHSIESSAFDFTDSPPERIGESIGPYRVVRTLGQGGMGEVVLAERDDRQFRQHVAIKLVKRGTLSRHVQGRLKAERQILASLDHPNIARLLDGGTTIEGTPYIVMEYIEGEAIDVYCDKLQLDIEGRLKLFRTVCSAVHCAHQNLIVHRDLKPSNILVTADSTPKLLDFGIAKILDDPQMMHTMAVTQMDMRVMTPEHASPEQIRGEQLTTASDTYALGVLLYLLLTGRKPYKLTSSRLSEIEDVICEQAPLPLSDALVPRGNNAQEIAALCSSRSTTLTKLKRDLTGDLSNIVMTALRKEPERRYASVEKMSSDIERFLAHMPVAATKDSWQYRSGKFVRRNRFAVASAVAAVLGLTVFAVTTTLQARRIALEQARSAQVSSFLIDMFEQADPTHSRGREMTVREMLDIGSRRIGVQLADQPDTRAHLQATVGKVYADLGLYDEAEGLLRESIATRTKLYGPTNLSTATAMQSLGDVLVKKKDLNRAEPLLEEALAINRSAFGNNDMNLTASIRSLSELRQEQQQLSVAEELLRESLQILAKSEPKAGVTEPAAIDAETAATLNRLAIVLRQKGDYPAAEEIYRRALAVAEKSLGHDHPTSAFIQHNLAKVIELQGRLTEAQPLYNESLGMYRKVLGVEHPETMIAIANYGMLLQRMNDLDGAERIFREVLASRRKVLGDRHSRVGYDRVNLGSVLNDRGAYNEAEAEFRSALDIYEDSPSASDTFKGVARRSLAVSLIALGRNREAEQELHSALKIFGKGAANKGPQLLATRATLGKALADQKRFAEAAPLLRETYPELLATLGPKHPIVVRSHGWIEQLYKDMGRPEQAQQFFAELQTAPNSSR